jgi:predicted RND superfamily exporter protein
MTKPFLWIVDHPVLTSRLLLLATAWFASQLPLLKIDASAEIQMLQDDPDHVYYAQTKERFGDDNLTVILIKADDVFSPPILAAIKRITTAVEALDGVKRADSLSTVDQIKGEGD